MKNRQKKIELFPFPLTPLRRTELQLPDPIYPWSVWYLSGLDHEAHYRGMEKYREYFVNTTDGYIKKMVDKLKELGEFDNKIFIIVSDHGMTEMPTNLPSIPDETGKLHDPDISCILNLKNFDKDEKKYAELANNNLHIWELANLFTQFPSPYLNMELKILTPKEIASITKAATSDIHQANIIAALNGPMAHLYLKGTDWQGNPNPRLLDMVLNRLNKVLKEGSVATGSFGEKVKEHFPRLGSSVEAILVRRTLDGEYEVYRGDISNNSTYVNAMKRIKDMKHKDRSGDIILIMKDDMGDISQRYSTGSACKAWHGSLNRSDSYVPLIMAYPGGNRHELKPIINGTEGCSYDGGCDGNWRVMDLIKKIVRIQSFNQ